MAEIAMVLLILGGILEGIVIMGMVAEAVDLPIEALMVGGMVLIAMSVGCHALESLMGG